MFFFVLYVNQSINQLPNRREVIKGVRSSCEIRRGGVIGSRLKGISAGDEGGRG